MTELENKGATNAEFVFFAWAGTLLLALVSTVMLPVSILIAYFVGDR